MPPPPCLYRVSGQDGPRSLPNGLKCINVVLMIPLYPCIFLYNDTQDIFHRHRVRQTTHSQDLFHRSRQIYTDIYRYIQIYTDIYRSRQIYTDIYRYIQIYTDMYRSRQIYTDIYRYIQIQTQLFYSHVVRLPSNCCLLSIYGLMLTKFRQSTVQMAS